MAALAGEPWRGAARAAIVNTLNNNIGRDAWVSFSVAAAAPTGDQAIWGWATEEGGSGTHSAALTLRFRWANRSGGGVEDVPNFATVEMRVPGAAIIGAAWSVAFPAENTEVTRTFHFDSDPLSQALDALRAGTVELYINWGNSGGLAPWTVDSRGGSTGVDPGNTNEWARGYARSRAVLSANSISNVAIADAEPETWATPDSIFTRISLATVVYRSITPTLTLRRPSNGAQERGAAHAGGTGANFDYSWTATDGGQTAQVSDSMQAASEAKDLRFDFAALDFGGDNEYVWATTGHQSGWTRDSDLSLRYPARITVDPRVHGRRPNGEDGFYFQNNRTSFDTDFDEALKQMLSTDTGKAAIRIVNARNEGLNGLSYKLTSTSAVTGAQNTLSGTTGTQDGEAGWSGLIEVCPNGKPGGNWALAADITSGSPTIDADTHFTGNTGSVLVLSTDSRVRVYVDGGDLTRPGAHWSPGQPLTVGITVMRLRTRISPDPGSEMIAVLRVNAALGRVEYFDSDGIWKFGDDVYGWPLGVSPGDSKLFISTFSGAQTASWSAEDVELIGFADVNSVPYNGPGKAIAVSPRNRHDTYKFDPTGLFK